MRIIKFRCWKDGEMHEDGESKFWLSQGFDYNFMQFTGLLDKVGKEIYEGDIFVSVENDEVYVVGDMLPLSRHLDFLAENVGYFTDTKHKKFEKRSVGGQYHLDDWVSNPEFYEIIGNIYESPEILNQKT